MFESSWPKVVSIPVQNENLPYRRVINNSELIKEIAR